MQSHSNTAPTDSRKLQGIADAMLLAAGGISMFLSIYLWFSGQKDAGLFVGIWVPSILAFGCFLNTRRQEADQ